MSALRVLHTESSTGWGGQELRILAEAAGMRQRGREVWIAAVPGSPIAGEAAALDLPVIPVRFRRPHALADVLRLRGAIRRLAIPLVNTHSSWDSWIAGLAARLVPGTAVIRTRHLSTPIARSPLSRLLYCRVADRVVTTGEAIRRQMIRDNGFPPAAITSVVTGVDLGALQPRRDAAAVRRELGLPDAVTVIGTLATVRTWKGHLDLLDAVKRLESREVRLLLVGDGPHAGVVRSAVKTLGLTAVVTMPGQRRDVADLLQIMDVFAFPSYANEGVPQAVLQAMALRRPVVAAAVGGIPEVVRHGSTGLLVPPRDPAALAAAIGEVLEDRRAALRRAEEGYALIRCRYTLEGMLDQMDDVYREVLRPGRAPGLKAG